MEEHEKIARAQQQVEAITGFYIHVVVYVLVIALLVVINYAVSETWWVQWPFLGWGIGILTHAFAVFAKMPNPIRNWQLKKIRELKDNM